LRAYLARQAERFQIPTIVRWSNEGDGMLLTPPALRHDGTWGEQVSELVPRASIPGAMPRSD
jgi:hypothetical protein